jgi:DNA-binding transcriptional MerR regulator
MEGMAIQDVQFATGLSSHTLRYYEKAGLMINPIPRAANGHTPCTWPVCR